MIEGDEVLVRTRQSLHLDWLLGVYTSVFFSNSNLSFSQGPAGRGVCIQVSRVEVWVCRPLGL